jgi:microcystin-dependent protein
VPGVEAGTILPFGGGVVPSGYLLCDGAAVSRTSFAALFAAIGVAFGVGDGSSTFNLPDGRGRVLVGRDATSLRITGGLADALGKSGGIDRHLLVAAEMPVHLHVQNAHGHTQVAHDHVGIVKSSATGGPGAGDGAWDVDGIRDAARPTDQKTPVINNETAVNQNAGGGAAHQNLQPFLTGNYIIKT